MTSGAFSRALIHTCTIQRAATSRSASGDQLEAWSDEYTSVACRFVQKQERVVAPDQSLQMVERNLLLLKSDQDVTESDRVTDIELNGSTVDSGPFRIEALLQRHGSGLHHLSLTLERVD